MDREKLALSRMPERPGLAVLRVAAGSKDDPPLAPILRPRLELDIAVARKRPQIVAHRRTVGNERARQFGERRRLFGAGDFRQDRVLGRSQTGGRQRFVVELSEWPRGLARRGGETFAGVAAERGGCGITRSFRNEASGLRRRPGLQAPALPARNNGHMPISRELVNAGAAMRLSRAYMRSIERDSSRFDPPNGVGRAFALRPEGDDRFNHQF